MERRKGKIWCAGMVALLLISLVGSGVAVSPHVPQGDAADSGSKGQLQGQGQQEQMEQETQNTGEDTAIQMQQREEVRAQKLSEVRVRIEQREQEMVQEMQSLGEEQQLVYQNQNQVRLAVHSLLAMEDLVGSIGPQVSQIAREFNNSVHATIRAEEQIQSRNRITRLFIGGDEDAAQEIEQQVIQNQERIRQLQQLIQACECDEEIRAMLQEQVQAMEQEQTRLQEVARQEKNQKGIFGWLWK
ncbi:MAG: hypothetical protein EFT35_07190 [Methanophagales archaeon ANME-1-THS]|nr:MAG: hypothetical protein EFT35_07190 [Methanophagales archaeon ANME-1-THS]